MWPVVCVCVFFLLRFFIWCCFKFRADEVLGKFRGILDAHLMFMLLNLWRRSVTESRSEAVIGFAVLGCIYYQRMVEHGLFLCASCSDLEDPMNYGIGKPFPDLRLSLQCVLVWCGLLTRPNGMSMGNQYIKLWIPFISKRVTGNKNIQAIALFLSLIFLSVAANWALLKMGQVSPAVRNSIRSTDASPLSIMPLGPNWDVFLRLEENRSLKKNYNSIHIDEN